MLCLPHHSAHHGIERCTHLLIFTTGWKVPEDKNCTLTFVFSPFRLRITQQVLLLFTKLVKDNKDLLSYLVLPFLEMHVNLIR